MLREELRHLKIAEDLISGIQEGIYKEDEKIPSESVLCDKFHVNRHVVRQAIARITNLGWVTPVQGKGSFVNRIAKPIPYVLSSKTCFTDNMDDQGIVHQSRLLEWEKRQPSEEEQEHLEICENERIYELEILRYADHRPISITTTLMPEDDVPHLENYLKNFRSLYQVLLDHYHLRPIRSKSIFQATLPVMRDAEFLKIPENVPIVQIESFVNHPSGHPIEYSVSRIRGDMHKCLVEF